MRRPWFLPGLLLLAMSSRLALADAGTLIPKDKQAPDPAVLSLEEMRVDITIEDGDAHVSVVHIFRNHTANIEEGMYRFALPTGSTVSDFAVWDGPVRISAVILERKRAEQVYDQARLQAIDPGLLEMGERDTTDARSTAQFTAKIVPIPAYGTKRLELDYHQRLATADFKQFFALPLQPDGGQQQTVRSFRLHLLLHSAHAIEAFTAGSKLKLTTNDAHTVEGMYEATDLALTDDFQVSWKLSSSEVDQLAILTHRDPHVPLPAPGGKASERAANPAEPGFFSAQLLVADPPAATMQHSTPQTVILLFDTSLSMQWEKLERSYAAFEATLRSLKPVDSFNVLLFNTSTTAFSPKAVAASPGAIQQALECVRASKLRGGTDLLRALTEGLAQATQPDTTLALFTDGGSDRGETVVPAKIAARYAALWKAAPHPPHTAVYAVGDDANLVLLRGIAHNGGFLESVLSTEPADFHLQSFVSKLRRTPVAGLVLTLTPEKATSLVYVLEDTVYPGSMASWIGQYQPSTKSLQVAVRGERNGESLQVKAETPLPAIEPNHAQLPRIWAQARVDALLAGIDRDGETAAAIDEIIRLSRRYKFVTPYTSFLAVPRSLLRPRVIRPGDPVLRVRTDSAIASVIALFPFGLTKPLRHLASEDLTAPGDAANRLWETRFLAPPEMKDGTYTVRLILRDTAGNSYREAKTFVIASTPPTVKVHLARTSLHRGEALEIHAAASASTRMLVARLPGAAPVTLHWNAGARSNEGLLVIPNELAPGRYVLMVTAEDVAHNLGSEEVQIDVIP